MGCQNSCKYLGVYLDSKLHFQPHINQIEIKVAKAVAGFIRSGKIRGKHIFFEMVRESQGKSGKVREFNEKVRENLEKVREIFLESSYLL